MRKREGWAVLVVRSHASQKEKHSDVRESHPSAVLGDWVLFANQQRDELLFSFCVAVGLDRALDSQAGLNLRTSSLIGLCGIWFVDFTSWFAKRSLF